MLTRDAANEVKRAALPTKPEEYKVETTQAFKLPEGVQFTLKQEDPLWPQAKAWAHKYGISQDAFAEAIDLVAGSKVADQLTYNNAEQAEIAKLGANGSARVTAVKTFISALIGEDAKAFDWMLRTAAGVTGFEKMIAKFQTQGSGTFSHQHREPPNAPGRLSQAEYDALPAGAKWDYARQFPQDQFRTNGAGR